MAPSLGVLNSTKMAALEQWICNRTRKLNARVLNLQMSTKYSLVALQQNQIST